MHSFLEFVGALTVWVLQALCLIAVGMATRVAFPRNPITQLAGVTIGFRHPPAGGEPLKTIAVAMDDVSIADIKLKLALPLLDEDGKNIKGPDGTDWVPIPQMRTSDEVRAIIEDVTADGLKFSVRSGDVGFGDVTCAIPYPDGSLQDAIVFRFAIGNSAPAEGSLDALVTIRREDAPAPVEPATPDAGAGTGQPV